MLVSICIPAFNSPETLKKCLESILMQDFVDYEIIVSDDSSTDDVSSLIGSMDIGHKMVYTHNPEPLGSPANWNNAIKLANGKYIKMLHHDDYFRDKKSLGKFVAALEQSTSAHFAFSQTNIFFKSENEHFIHEQTEQQLTRLRTEPEYLFFRNVIGAPSATIFRNHTGFLFDPKYKWLVDTDFYIRYLKGYKSFVSIPEPLVTVVDGEDGQISRDVSNDRKVVVNENLELFSSIYEPSLDHQKSWLYFEELFSRFEINTLEELKNEFYVPVNILPFIHNVFEDLPKNVLLKQIKKRLLTSRYNKRIFKIERF